MARRPSSKPVKKLAKPTKPAKKPRVTISTSKIFKHTHKAKPLPKSLAHDFKHAISTARKQITTSNSGLLTQIHTTALSRLNETRNDFSALVDSAITNKNDLLAPLETETYTITAATSEKDSSARKRQEKTVMLGERVAAFKTLISAKEAELSALWQEWTQVQKDLITAFAAPEKSLQEPVTEVFKDVEVGIKTSIHDVILLMRESEKELDLVRKKNLLAIVSNM
ncbi:MAG: hypothetical protein M1839_009570 [Geoglossum umbratile]|nr:MAG: hypothetical protein M1839_009570 [Geoglossum umbratile]